MDKLLALLQAHASFYDGDECKCGMDFYTSETGHSEHLAEMLLDAGVHVGREYCMMAPLPAPFAGGKSPADVYMEGFAAGFDLAADNIGSWDTLADHGVVLTDYGLTNPYEETETE